MVTEERLHELLDYDPETGVFTWKVDYGRTAKAGSEAKGSLGSGYRRISIDGRGYAAHRLVILWLLGVELPDGLVTDHVNGIRDDNRAANLRAATPSQNAQNSRLARNNTSGFKGVYWVRKHRKWVAKIQSQGRKECLGHFIEREKAAMAVRTARRHLHGEYARHA